MKRILWTVGGICAAAAGILVWGSKRTPDVEQLAHRLEDAWADHHTTVSDGQFLSARSDHSHAFLTQ
jgi:cbb3-type cytochrome oxidase cytochrome c subunit